MPARPNNEHIKSLQLLLHETATRQADLCAVLTAAPEVWEGFESENMLFVDITNLLGARSPWAADERRFHSRLEQEVFRELLGAGWPEHLMQSDFRLNAKRALQLDIAVLGVDSKVAIAFEVKGISHGIDAADAWRDRVFNETDIPWVCVTNGMAYELSSRTGECVRLEHAPVPSDIGLTLAVSPTPNKSDKGQVLKPNGVSALQAIGDEHEPKRFIVDFTVPWGLRVQRDSQLLTLVPEQLRAVRPLETTSLLMLWASDQDSTEEIAAICPPAVAWSPASQPLREWLGTRLGLAAHLELPTGLLAPMTGIRPSFLLFGGHQESSYFNSISSVEDFTSVESRTWYTSLKSVRSGDDPDIGFEKESAPHESWAIAANDPYLNQTRDRVLQLGNSKLLGEDFDVFQGPHVPRDAITDSESGEIEVFDGRRLRQVVDADETASFRYVDRSHPIRDRDYLCDGDLLLTRMWTQTSGVIEFESSNPAIAANSLLVLRPKNEAASPRFLAEFLNSATGQQLLTSIAAGTSIPQISVSALRDLPVPVIGIDLAEPLDEIVSIRDELLSRARDLDVKRSGLFDSEDADEFQTRLRELERRGVVLQESLRRAESLEFQVSQFYPFPISYGYRLLASLTNPHEAYREQLRVAENFLAFLGSVSIALLTDEDRGTQTQTLLKAWQGGISPGDWKAIASRSAKLLSVYEGHPLGTAIACLNVGSEKKGLGKEFYQLIVKKNDFKHDRGPKVEADLRTHGQEIYESLTTCMSTMAFWTRHPIRMIRDIDVDRRSPGRVRLDCSRITGDHPGFQREEVHWTTPLAKRDLHIEITDRYWAPLYPYVQVLGCSTCGVDEIYFVDRWDGPGSPAVMKSFERGHTLECQETSEALTRAIRPHQD